MTGDNVSHNLAAPPIVELDDKALAFLDATARGMVTQADRIRDRDPRDALQLGVAARQFDASPQTQP